MKILKHGLRPEERVHEATCMRCKSVIEFKEGEAERRDGGQREGILLKIQCPVCDYEIWKGL